MGGSCTPTQGLQKVKTYIYKYSYIWLQKNSEGKKSNNKPQKNCLITVTAFHCVLGFSLGCGLLSHTQSQQEKLVRQMGDREKKLNWS